MQNLRHIFQLGIKELLSLARDPVLLFLIAYSFTFSVYTPAKSAVMDVVNASVAIVDEDDSEASRRIPDALLLPLFLPAVKLPFSEINRAMNEGRFTFIIDIPPRFQSDLSRGVAPTVEVIADATAMSQAGRGPEYIRKIIEQEAQPFWSGRGNPLNRDLAQTRHARPIQSEYAAKLVRRGQPDHQQYFRTRDLLDRRGGAAGTRARNASSISW